jgi:hypothetical protein
MTQNSTSSVCSEAVVGGVRDGDRTSVPLYEVIFTSVRKKTEGKASVCGTVLTAA